LDEESTERPHKRVAYRPREVAEMVGMSESGVRGDAVVGGRTSQESRSTGQPAAASVTDSTILWIFKE
jgi:hypothetical protein